MEIKRNKSVGKLSVDISLCKVNDLKLLESEIPSHGKSKFHEKRLRAQKKGLASYLIAWHKDKPVGHILIKWGGLGRDLPKDLSKIPELNSLVVVTESRHMGVARLLIKKAEDIVRQKGFKDVGLLVSVNNKYAMRLYEYLGYEYSSTNIYTDSGEMIDDDGNRYIDSEDCLAMIKDL